MNESQIEEFQAVYAKMEGLYTEALTLSKKSPSDAFNKFKLKITNNVLAGANRYLTTMKIALPIEGLSQFDDVQLPTNSDVVFVLSQYLHVLETLRCKHIDKNFNGWFWRINGALSPIRAAPPRKLG